LKAPEDAKTTHDFAAIAFEENLSLRELAPSFPSGRLGLRDLQVPCDGGEFFLYPFGAVVFHNVPPERRDAEMARLHRARPGLTTKVVRESFAVREEPQATMDIVDGTLVVDALTPTRAAVVALIVAQSAAMEYYERIVAALFARSTALVDPLERRGTVSLRTRPLHRFIGQAVSTRSEVVAVLALLDKPDATWDDPALDRIYDDLRSEFDLSDRYDTLTQKLHGSQETLELVLDVARDRRMWLLEIAIFLLIAVEVLMELVRRV
jgi:required for meiotic nuclear division protein 1